MEVYSVVTHGMEAGEWGCVGVFSSYKKARDFAAQFSSWGIDSHYIDEPERED